MNILVAANNNYYLPLKVMLTSLLENNDYEQHDIYLMYHEMNEDNVNELKKFIWERYHASVHPIHIRIDLFEGYSISHHFSIETYFRFLVQDIIPKSQKRILWLDSDMVVLKSLKDFYYQDFEDKSLVVCKSINKDPQALLSKLQCPNGAVYFNAGTILFNLEKIREEVSFKTYSDFYLANKDRITWLDQDVLNAVFALKTKIDDYKMYNMQFFDMPNFSKEELKELEKKTVILHFIGSVKPWHREYRNACKKYWYRYAKKVLHNKEYKSLKKEAQNYCLKSKIYNGLLYQVAHKVKVKLKIGKYKLLFLRRLHGRIHEWKIRKIAFLKFLKYIWFPFGEKVYIIGTPTHTNIGDSAIVIAERLFLEKCQFAAKKIKEISVEEYRNYSKWIAKILKKKELVCLHGGGNMGDTWLGEEHLRQQMLQDFADNKIVVFPQTIYFSETEKGSQEKQRSVEVYNSKTNLTLIAREKKSFEIMKALYPNAQILLTPDIVLSLKTSDLTIEKTKRNGILLCMRDDIERSMTEEQRSNIEDFLKVYGCSYRKIDMHAKKDISKDIRRDVVIQKLREFAGSECIITDRLHGMIFAAITETPCIVFSNHNHKVKGTYEWIQYLPYIRYVNNVEEAKAVFDELRDISICKYDNESLGKYFDEILI